MATYGQIPNNISIGAGQSIRRNSGDTAFEAFSSGDMNKSVYDTDNDGIVDNSEALGGQAGSYYLSRANHTGTQTSSTISDINTYSGTLTNKTLDDYSNFIHADGVHLKVKSLENLVNGDVIKFVGFNSGEQAIEVRKRDSHLVPAIGIIHGTITTGNFGLAVNNGLFKNIDTSAFAEGTILYPNTSGGFTSTPTIENGNYNQPLAYVVRSHATNGEIMLNVGPGHDIASMVAYDNIASGLTATNVKTAIDEVDSKIDTHDHTTIGAQIQEGGIILSDNTTNNATTLRHGFLPKLSGSGTEYLNGQGNYATPSGTTNSFTTQTFTSQTSVNVIHNFGTYPVVDIIDNSNNVIIPLEITHNTANDFTVTFTSATTGRILATVGSPQPNQYIAVNSNYTILPSDRVVNLISGNATLTLPTASGATGRQYQIKNSGNGVATIATTSSQTIDGTPSSSITLSQYEALSVCSDGANWIILADL